MFSVMQAEYSAMPAELNSEKAAVSVISVFASANGMCLVLKRHSDPRRCKFVRQGGARF
jgi:hypothetical protein